MLADSLHIRPFETRDQDAVRRLILDGLGEHFGFVDETVNPDLDNIAETYVDGGHRFMVATAGDNIVACGCLVLESSIRARIVRMSVAGHARRRGIGRMVVHQLLDHARDVGVTSIVLETNNYWEAVIAFYESCGFNVYDRSPGNVHMKLKLAGRVKPPS